MSRETLPLDDEISPATNCSSNCTRRIKDVHLFDEPLPRVTKQLASQSSSHQLNLPLVNHLCKVALAACHLIARPTLTRKRLGKDAFSLFLH